MYYTLRKIILILALGVVVLLSISALIAGPMIVLAPHQLVSTAKNIVVVDQQTRRNAKIDDLMPSHESNGLLAAQINDEHHAELTRTLRTKCGW